MTYQVRTDWHSGGTNKELKTGIVDMVVHYLKQTFSLAFMVASIFMMGAALRAFINNNDLLLAFSWSLPAWVLSWLSWMCK